MNRIKESSTKRIFRDNGKNCHSSRSHHIFQIRITRTGRTGLKNTSFLNIVDLAGSERREKSNNIAGGLQEQEDINNEAKFINQSLSTLGRIFNMLTNKTNRTQQPPYRESKLTHLLQPSLHYESCKCLMIVHVRQSAD